jgi:hypothetical protein
MCYTLHAIHPQDWETHNIIVLTILEDLIRCNKWYHDDDHHHYHQIWREWREGHTNTVAIQGKEFPSHLEYFFWNITNPRNAIRIADSLDIFDGDDVDLKQFICWVKHWAFKGAYFILKIS